MPLLEDDHCHCQEDTGHVTGLYSAVKDEKDYWKVENLGTEATYRCISCRNCAKCRDSENQEATKVKNCVIPTSRELLIIVVFAVYTIVKLKSAN